MKRALPLALLAALVLLGFSAAGHAATFPIAPGFLLTVDDVPAAQGVASNAADLGDLFSASQALACPACSVSKSQCRLDCSEAGCFMQNWWCSAINPCNYNCYCFCN